MTARSCSAFASAVETLFELMASGERQHPIQPVGSELPELLGGGCTPRVDYMLDDGP